MPMYKKSMLVLIVLVVAALGGTYYGLYATESEVVESLPVAQYSAADRKITVYVTGGVNKPGLVQLPEGARAAEAVNACGGLLPTADSEKVNLAQTLKDGQQLRVPERKLDGTGARSQAKDYKGLVNINTADEKALDSLPGVGPAMAKRIIEYRETEGAFQSIEDIKKIKGIGETKFAKLKDKICI